MWLEQKHPQPAGHSFPFMVQAAGSTLPPSLVGTIEELPPVPAFDGVLDAASGAMPPLSRLVGAPASVIGRTTLLGSEPALPAWTAPVPAGAPPPPEPLVSTRAIALGAPD